MALIKPAEEHLRKAPFHPRLFGFNGAVTSEHYLAANAGADLLKAGGNAIDAAVGAALVEGVVNPHQHTIGGECPMIIYLNGQEAPVVVNGNTTAPKAATVNNYRARGLQEVPDTGILAAGVPAAVGAYTTALKHFGTMSFEQVSHAALTLAGKGFPIHRGLVYMPDFGVAENEDKFRKTWPNTGEIYLPHDGLPEPGYRIKNQALAQCIEAMVQAERSSAGSRQQGIEAVRQIFYEGDIASEIARHSAQRDGFLNREDLRGYNATLESAVSVEFDDTRIYKCGPWNQGPALLQSLCILKNFPLQSYDHNSAEYLHVVIEAVKLAFADREQWYGDPKCVSVPIKELLSDYYGQMRSKLIDSNCVNSEICPGDPVSNNPILPVEQRLGGKSWGHGTVHVDAVDKFGNMVAATPSGGWLKSSEVVKSIGVPLGNRLMTFYLQPENHPNLAAPGKQPRTTISPTMVYRQGKPWMVYGSMGGDQQDQWMLQFILNRVVFGMTIAQAIEAPKFSSQHFPGFFAPHDWSVNQVSIEKRVGDETFRQLQSLGHNVEPVPDWTEGFLLAIERDPQSGLLEAGYDPRGAKGDVFPAAAICW